MIRNLPSLEKLVALLQKIPHIPSKNIFKITDFFLQMDNKKIEQFCELLTTTRASILLCKKCYFFTEKNDLCQFCLSAKRIKNIICVVETWQDVLAIEKTDAYDGMYHVLGGTLSPLEGRTHEDLTIKQLVNRIETESISEIILCTNQTPEGEATAMFVARRLKDVSVKISCLARGLPVGSLLGNSDKITVYKALANRRPF